MKLGLLPLGIVTFAGIAFAQPTVVQGGFSNGPAVSKSQQADYLLLQVKLKVGNTIVAKSSVQADGHFTIENSSDVKADLVYSGMGVSDDVYLATVSPHQPKPLTIQIELPVSAPMKRGVAKCPKCQRRDKVLPIDGRAGVLVRTVDAKGDTVLWPYDKAHYYPDSDVSSWLDPRWYCVRDTIKF